MAENIARHPRPPEFEGANIEDIANQQVAHFSDRKPDWAAFADALIDGYRRAQHRFRPHLRTVAVNPPRPVADKVLQFAQLFAGGLPKSSPAFSVSTAFGHFRESRRAKIRIRRH